MLTNTAVAELKKRINEHIKYFKANTKCYSTNKEMIKVLQDIKAVLDKLDKNRSASATGKMSKNKGSSFERKVVKLFKNNDLDCERTPRSGAMGKTIKSSIGADFSGDLIFSDSNIPISVECKNHESFDVCNIVDNNCSYFKNWWKQCQEDANRSNRFPVLVCTRNRLGIYCFFKPEDFDKKYGNTNIGNFRPLLYVNFKQGKTNNKLAMSTLKDFIDNVLKPYIKKN